MGRAKDLIDGFAREEDAFLKTEFIAPVGPGGVVRVRIAGMVCELTVAATEARLAVLRPRSHREAEVVRAATKAEARKYLEIFPRARLVAAHKYGDTWMGLPASAPEKGAEIEGLVPIAFASTVQLFDTVVVRFDGSLFLFEATDRGPVATYLRGALAKSTPVDALDRKGLTEPERRAYAWQLKVQIELAKSAEERRLEQALELGGANLVRYAQRHGTFEVTYRVDGTTYTSIVSTRDLTVVSSGVCLSGRDRDFDLTSLVSVMKERTRGR
jgi:hypothetical protein